MKANEASCGPWTPPTIAPVSCWGKNPLGILTMTTTFSAMVSSQHDQDQHRIVERPGQRTAIDATAGR